MSRMVLALLVACFLTGCDQPKPPPSKAASPPGADEPEAHSPWDLSTAHNDLSGQITFTAITAATHGDASLIVRLVGKKLECYVNTQDFLETIDNMNSRRSLVGYKFDDGRIVRQEWVISDDNKALFVPGNPTPFIQRMRKAKLFVIEYSPTDVLPKTATFDVSLFPEEIVNALKLK
jgi:hypothetical protein